MNDTVALDAKKALFERQADILKSISEREFKATLQAFTLNLVVIAGLISARDRIRLVESEKMFGALTLAVFNLVVIWYQLAKSWSHGIEKKLLYNIQVEMLSCAGLTPLLAGGPPNRLLSFCKGTLPLVIIVLVSGLWSSLSVWYAK